MIKSTMQLSELQLSEESYCDRKFMMDFLGDEYDSQLQKHIGMIEAKCKGSKLNKLEATASLLYETKNDFTKKMLRASLLALVETAISK